jgi:Raf kinase inhibitor-like YbhB/YbcL family protein
MLEVIGKVLNPVRAGESELVIRASKFESVPATIQLTSPAFADGGRIPALYTVEAGDISPPLAWENVPAETQELVLIMEDYDVPFPHPLLHLLIYSLAPSTTGLAEGTLPSRHDDAQRPGLLLGRNSMHHQRYDGPAPIPGHGPHHYVFQLFALAETTLFDEVPNRGLFLDAIKDKTVLATGRLTGTYER